MAAIKKNKLMYGAYSTVLIILVIIAVVALNSVFHRIESRNALKLDLTKNKLFSLDTITLDMLKSLDKDIYIYCFIEQAYENEYEVMLLKELLNKYSAAGKRITVEFLDPKREPTLVAKFQSTDNELTGPVDLVICEGNARTSKDFRFRPPITMNSLIDAQTRDIIAERIITGAILSFSETQTVNLWFLGGHGNFAPENN
ncbi:MAG TPA: Gldg family protein, partial [Clostridia bacterium]|nr:Gldg family protein [Clostridia bacterium]